MTISALDLKQLRQKDAEHGFAYLVNQYPLYALQQCGWLSPSLILDQQVRKYWEIIRERLEPNVDDDTASTVAIQAQLECGINGDMNIWGRDIDLAATPQAYAQELNRRSYLTMVTAHLGEIWKHIQADDDVGVKELIAKVDENGNHGMPSSMQPLSEVHDRFVQLANDGQRSVETFISPIDNALGGMERQTLVVLAARPSMGKSALALQIARNIAMNSKRVIFFSLEMSAVSLWSRVACPLVGVTWRDVLANRISKEKKKELEKHSKEIMSKLSNNLAIIDTRQTTESIWRTVAANHPDAIIIDHLRFIKDKGENENKRQGAICEALHDLAKSYDLPVLLLVQLNRDTEKGVGDKRPQLSNLRDSGEIEETADVVLMMYRNSYYNPPNPPKPKDDTEIWVRKFRNGPSGIKIELLFDMQAEWFEGINQINNNDRRDYTDI